MGKLQQIQLWSASHHPRWLILLRVALGLCLFVKGIFFLTNTTLPAQLVQDSIVSKTVDWLPLLVTWIHLLGGFLIIIGLFTRWAVLVQIPILAGAVIFINTQRGRFNSASELIFASVILLLLIFFFIEGGGPVSLDNYFRKHPK